MSDNQLGRPITPQEARIKNAGEIPSAVYDVFNSFLITRVGQSHIGISRDEVVTGILAAMPNVRREDIFDYRWLDIEDAYVKAGWEVTFSRQSNLGVGKIDLGGSYPHWTFVQPAQMEKKPEVWVSKAV